ncbi:hypothetical protein K437DRAFT_276122 [Tilletiaria anomala UBC 951]|uniref:SIN1-domain-containing protein n=1 Tax=Tilletiaria anomala (strain ATCC 24038 / CBS 436.72 / UBC 951) TaxID=1037660 RepID=A0A066VBG7_TILAU|nr:uncharacterized protein K437DRAFT_276122 [Tilletiaria anomala UBC 951]KDN39097.1 hypothetical protein K437DRAFT_276122 [Tilletiaria anomala UBC 951]
MSLIADPDYMLYSLRLAYLRRVDDACGPRIISFPDLARKEKAVGGFQDSTVTGEYGAAHGDDRSGPAREGRSPALSTGQVLLAPDSHVVIGELNDPEAWPEIDATHSPLISTPLADFASRHGEHNRGASGSGVLSKHKPGSLGYTQTIYGPGRSGALGMRVSGKRASMKITNLIRSKYGGRGSIEVIAEDSSFQERSESKDALSPREATPLASGLNQDEHPAAAAPEQTGWRGALQERLRKLATAATAEHPPSSDETARSLEREKPTPLAGATAPSAQTLMAPAHNAQNSPSRSGSSSGSGSSGPVGPPPARPARRVYEPSGQLRQVPSSEAGQFGLSSTTRDTGRPRSSSSSSNVSVSSSGAGSILVPLGSASSDFAPITSSSDGFSGIPNMPPSEQNSKDLAADSAMRTRSSSEGATMMPPIVAFNNLGFSSLEAVDRGAKSRGNDEPQGFIEEEGSVLNATEMKWQMGAHSGAKDSNVLAPNRSLETKIERSLLTPPQDFGSEKTPITEKRFFTPITEMDKPYFPSPLHSHEGHADISESPALHPVDLSAFTGDPSEDKMPTAMPSPRIQVSEIDPRGDGVLSSERVSDLGSPASLGEDASLPDVGQGELLPASQASSGNICPFRQRFEGDSEVTASDSALGLVLPPKFDTHAVRKNRLGALNTLSPSPAPAPKDAAGSEANVKGQDTVPTGVAPTIPGRMPKKVVDNDWFMSLRRDPTKAAFPHTQVKVVSALTAKLKKQDAAPENPFAPFYAGVAARSGGEPSIAVDVYLPFASTGTTTALSKPATSSVEAIDVKAKRMRMNVRKDATMEELIGFGLFCLVEQGWGPSLHEESVPETQKGFKLTTVGWVLRVVEDGEVDDDYPAIDRTLTVGRFGNDEFAIVEANETQIKHNQAAYNNIKRRISRTTGTSKMAMSGLAPLNADSLNALTPHSVPVNEDTSVLASSAQGRSLNAPMSTGVFLRVLVTPNSEVRYKTTLQVPSEMYLADVLEMICRKRHLSSPDEWALIVPDKDIIVPLDRTVESLQGTHDLALVRRSTLGMKGVAGALTGRSTNPNASIFNKRHSEPAQPRYKTMQDIASVYKSWTVTRKTPIFVSRHEQRSLTLDGDWIHIMPLDVRAFQTRAASFHVGSVTVCDISTKGPHIFKLIVRREVPRETKRYDFEADSPKQAGEIVGEIKALMRQHSEELKQRG